ncbi:hypothetical protein BS78_03G098200 [Paspalum vaginatum]|nr:hypothetical protein BS78_03G098200 [Paspalum vaginatum]
MLSTDDDLDVPSYLVKRWDGDTFCYFLGGHKYIALPRPPLDSDDEERDEEFEDLFSYEEFMRCSVRNVLFYVRI